MSNKIKVKIQVEVVEGYNDLFAHKDTFELDQFTKAGLLGVLNDVTKDLSAFVTRSVSLDKVEERHLLEHNAS